MSKKKNEITIIRVLDAGEIDSMLEAISEFISIANDEHSVELKIFSDGKIKIEGEITTQDSWNI